MPGKKIIKSLVIEDDPLAVSVLEHYGERLRSFKLEIFHALTHEESFILLEEHPEIELILLDYCILRSKFTGLEMLQLLRGKGINLPVIVVTGSGNEEIAVAMIKAGASDYLVKGHLNAAALEISIKDALEQYGHSRVAKDKKNDSILKGAAIEKSLNGICIMDFSGTLNYINPSFADMWGYANEAEALGRSIKEFLYNPGRFDELLFVLKKDKNCLRELIGKKKDGSKLYLQASLSLVEFKEEHLQQIMASFIDITKIKDAESKREILYRGIMEVFALTAEEVGNVETAGHIYRIAAYTQFIAEKLSEIEPFRGYIDARYINDISYASMLHDVGKWRTPNDILLKPAELNKAEWEIIRQHPKLGVEMLAPILKQKGTNQYLKLVESIVLFHHERWDGTGYPKGLKGDEIPLSARIVALADMYDALTSDRSYRKAITHEQTIEIMIQDKEKFDPRIWRIFTDNQLQFKKIRDDIQ